jgi:hypothetical protein
VESVLLWQRKPSPCVDVRLGSRYGFYCLKLEYRWRREDVVGGELYNIREDCCWLLLGFICCQFLYKKADINIR